MKQYILLLINVLFFTNCSKDQKMTTILEQNYPDTLTGKQLQIIYPTTQKEGDTFKIFLSENENNVICYSETCRTNNMIFKSSTNFYPAIVEWYASPIFETSALLKIDTLYDEYSHLSYGTKMPISSSLGIFFRVAIKPNNEDGKTIYSFMVKTAPK